MKSLSRVRLVATPWIAAYQAPPSVGFSRQEYWSGVPLPSPRWNYINGVKLLVDDLVDLGSDFASATTWGSWASEFLFVKRRDWECPLCSFLYK